MNSQWNAACAAIIVIVVTITARADEHPVVPLGEMQERHIDSGAQANARGHAAVVHSELVRTPGAAWTRLHFSNVELEPGSGIRFTALRDGQVQELDAGGVAMWSQTSAYFNGDAVLVELIAAPQTNRNRFVLESVHVGMAGQPAGGHCDSPLSCGLCDGEDNRVPSAENWVGRLISLDSEGPVSHGGGCSAAVFNANSCIVSAGHCMGTNMVMQFNVPLPDPDCSINHPPVEDQFPVTDYLAENAGVGADWAVLTTGTNNLGETAYERYGEYRPIASSTPGSGPVEFWGYGVTDDCTYWGTQQHSTGEIVDLNNSALFHTGETTCGNSGSAIVQDGEIIGIATHCTWSCPPNGNPGNRIDNASVVAAINTLCSVPGDLTGDGVVGGADLGVLLSEWGPCDDCDDCPADLTGDCDVGGADLGVLLSNWTG